MSAEPKAKVNVVDDDTGHEYDGIRELDNMLPAWWLTTFWGAIAFAVVYWGFYQTTGAGMSSAEALAEEMAQAQAAAEQRAEELEKAGKAPWSNDANLVALAQDSGAMERGKATFEANCAACHKADGSGLIGPNLTDPYWIHGEKPTQVFKTVAEGVVVKGMPAWKDQLGMTSSAEVTAYVLTLKGQNLSGKAPQGVDAQGTPAPTTAQN